jgi:hypothetical protein
MKDKMYKSSKGKADVYPSHPRACDDKMDAPYSAIEKVAKYRSDPLAHHMMNEAPNASRGEYKVSMIKDPSLFAHDPMKKDY